MGTTASANGVEIAFARAMSSEQPCDVHVLHEHNAAEDVSASLWVL